MVSKICNFLTWLILIVVVLISAVLLVPKAFGYQIYGVLSGSMEPVFHVGSVVYVEPATPADVAPGEPITFRLPDQNGLVATHRIVSIDNEARTFTTKGDANEINDLEPIPFDSLIGRAVFTIPYLGYLSLFLQTKQGLLAGGAVLLFVILLTLVSSLTDPKKKKTRLASGPVLPDENSPSPMESGASTDNTDNKNEI